jgi:hypothetical protein
MYMNIRIYCTGDKLFQPEKYAWVHGVNSTVQDSYHVLIKLIVRGDEKFFITTTTYLLRGKSI